MTEAAKPGILERLRARYEWLDHVMRAHKRFSDARGSFFAAALTYYTIFAIFPLLMVAFAVSGFALARRPELLHTIDDRIRASVSSELGQQLVDVMNSAIDARASVGVIGLATAAWAGLGWMWHLRESLSEMWAHPVAPVGYVRTKLSDLLAMVATFAVTAATIALTALGHERPMRAVLRWLEIPEFSVFDWIFRAVSVLVSFLVTWVLFTWMIARLPRESVRIVTSIRAGLMAAVGFELFKQVGSIYLQVVLRSPAGAAFGPVLGLMVFGLRHRVSDSVRHRVGGDGLRRDPRATSVAPPAPAIISPRIQLDDGLSTRQTAAAMAAGALGALTLSRLIRRR